jgi:catechol 2,3-dioxygenase-like lactoylglutathione lyase family enzyme
MTLRKIDHIQLAMPVGHEDTARGFYGDLLGLIEVAKPPQLAGRGGCWFELDEVRVHLGVDPDFVPARKAHPAFIVDDLDALCAVLQAAGFKTVHDQPLEGFLRKYVSDPFGNRIELMQVAEG